MAEVFSGFVYRWVIMRNLQEHFIWIVVSCAISSTMNRQKWIKIAVMTSAKKLINHVGSFENKVGNPETYRTLDES